MSANAGWIEGEWICSHIGDQNRKYWIEDNVVFGPINSGKFWIKDRYIYGPRDGGAYWIDKGRIYGPSEILPFAQTLEVSIRVLSANVPFRHQW